MSISEHQQGMNAIAKDIQTGREILAYANRNPQLAHMLDQRLSQANLFGLVRYLIANKTEWTTEADLKSSTIIGGIQRATLNIITGEPLTMFYRYELNFYTPAQLKELDPLAPPMTPPNYPK